MGDLLIRNLPPAVHEELKRRADGAAMSLQAYVTNLLTEHAERMPLQQWLKSLDELPVHPELSGAEIIRASRGDETT